MLTLTKAVTVGQFCALKMPQSGSILRAQYQAVSRLEGERAADAAKLDQDVVGWLKTDEHVLAGGLAAKLSDAESRAIRLLTPPKQVERKQHETTETTHGEKQWSMIRSGRKDRLSSKDWSTAAEELRQRLDENPRYRLTIDWTI